MSGIILGFFAVIILAAIITVSVGTTIDSPNETNDYWKRMIKKYGYDKNGQGKNANLKV